MADNAYADSLVVWLERGQTVKKKLIYRSHKFVNEKREHTH